MVRSLLVLGPFARPLLRWSRPTYLFSSHMQRKSQHPSFLLFPPSWAAQVPPLQAKDHLLILRHSTRGATRRVKLLHARQPAATQCQTVGVTKVRKQWWEMSR